MKKVHFSPLFLLFFSLYFLSCEGTGSFYDFTVNDANGKPVSLSKFKGKVSLVTNVASHCGFTDKHYKDYVALQSEVGSFLNILAFPCNQFGQQEPEDVSTIISNMKDKYDVNFEIFEKVDVLGKNVPDAWKFLMSESKTKPQWNFYKYLVNADGQVRGGWGPNVSIEQLKEFIKDAEMLQILKEREARRSHSEL